MGWRERLAPPDRPAPGVPASIASVGYLLVTPFALLYTWVDLALSSPTMVVPTEVVLDGYLDDVATHGSSEGDLVAAAPDGVVVEVVDPAALSLYFRTETLVAVGIGLAILVGAVFAVAALLRRPASRAVAGALALLAIYLVYASFAGPAAREAGERRIIEVLDLPTTDAAARSAGFMVWSGESDWHAWHSVLWVLALVSLGVAAWVLHVRRQAQLSRGVVARRGS